MTVEINILAFGCLIIGSLASPILFYFMKIAMNEAKDNWRMYCQEIDLSASLINRLSKAFAEIEKLKRGDINKTLDRPQEKLDKEKTDIIKADLTADDTNRDVVEIKLESKDTGVSSGNTAEPTKPEAEPF